MSKVPDSRDSSLLSRELIKSANSLAIIAADGRVPDQTRGNSEVFASKESEFGDRCPLLKP